MSSTKSATELDFVVEHAGGRLITTRIGVIRDLQQVAAIRSAVRSAILRAEPGAVFCTDWRAIRVFSPEVTDAFANMFTTSNKQVMRGAILLGPENATLSLQVERVLREAHSTVRKTFRSSRPMLAWLAEVLTPSELACATRFLESG